MTEPPDTVAAARARGLGPVELTEACLERARATASLGAFALLDVEGARAQARALAAAAGTRGPLHGIPVGVKDIIDVEGLPTRAGSTLPGDAPARADAPIVARLRRAGAVIVGKTTTHELAFGVTTPAAANPHDPAYSAGGSSGGSAVAVATGAVYAALGTDTAGSVRLPAAFCGVLGLKARTASLPMDGILPLAPSMDSAGCFARTAEDLALVWAVLAGEAVVADRRPAGERAAATSPAATPADRAAAAPLRVGVPDPAPDADPEIAAAVARAAGALGEPVRVPVPPWRDWARPRGRTLALEALDVHRTAGWYPARADEYGAEALGYLRAVERLSAADRAAARAALDDLSDRFRTALAAVDVLALPVSRIPPPRRDADPAWASFELTALVGPASAAGLAAASVPCGVAYGLPVGLQLVAADERTVLAAVRRLASVAGAAG